MLNFFLFIEQNISDKKQIENSEFVSSTVN